MTRSLSALALSGLLCVQAMAGAGPEPLPRSAPEAVGLAAARLGEATELLNRFVAERKIAGAVGAVARKGKLAYLEAVGLQDLEARTPMTERSMFRIYSMTKPVTAVAVMMLYEEGRFRLDDPVSKYLPAFKEVTVLASPDGSTRRPSRDITVPGLEMVTILMTQSSPANPDALRQRFKTLVQQSLVN